VVGALKGSGVFHRILVGVDDTPAARLALERAVELAESGHGRIGLLVSAPEPSGAIWASPICIPQSRAGMCQELERWACNTMEAATRAVPSEIPVTKLVTYGDPADALRREAAGGCWDLVVVGQAACRHGLPFRRPVGERLGTIATPVLVVREQPEPETGTRPADGPARSGEGLLSWAHDRVRRTRQRPPAERMP
jgi:nucleotide-binding universal stress UspA family protein